MRVYNIYVYIYTGYILTVNNTIKNTNFAQLLFHHIIFVFKCSVYNILYTQQ